MAEVGYLAVALAFGSAIYAAVASALGAARRVAQLAASGRRALMAAAILTTIAVAALFARWGEY